jgi:hypothetical protein
MPVAQDILTWPRVILCEGPEDQAFLHHLIEEHGLPRSHVRHTGGARNRSGGNTRFHAALRALRITRGFESVTDIVLMSDNDNNHRAAFENVRQQVEAAGFGPAPNHVLVPSASTPRITIMMIPLGGVNGTLERVCQAAARSTNHAIATCVDQFDALLHADQWQDEARRGKLWLRAYLAARSGDPFIALGAVFRHEQHLIPLRHRTIKALADALSGFLPAAAPSRGGLSGVRRAQKRGRNRPKTVKRRPQGRRQ